jgi:hypothetical protein
MKKESRHGQRPNAADEREEETEGRRQIEACVVLQGVAEFGSVGKLGQPAEEVTAKKMAKSQSFAKFS